MMNKEQFIKRMGLISNFRSEQETLQLLIEKVCDSSFVLVTIGDCLINEVVDMITEDFKLKDKDLLSWWLYEDVDKVLYEESEQGEKEISVRTLDELWEYLSKYNNENGSMSE